MPGQRLMTDPRGFDKIVAATSGLSASQTGVGTTNGTAFTLPITVEPARYGLRFSQPVFSLNISAGMTGTAILQANVNGSWVNAITVTIDSTGAFNVFFATGAFGSGNLTQFRAQVNVTGGAGTISVDFSNTYFIFTYGVQNEVIAAS